MILDGFAHYVLADLAEYTICANNCVEMFRGAILENDIQSVILCLNFSKFLIRMQNILGKRRKELA